MKKWQNDWSSDSDTFAEMMVLIQEQNFLWVQCNDFDFECFFIMHIVLINNEKMAE